jgi:hypothetical protein
LDDLGVADTDPVLESAGAAAERQTFDLDDLLHQDRHACERPASIRSRGSSAGAFGVQVDHGIELGRLFSSAESSFGQIDRVDRAGTDGCRNLLHGAQVLPVS